MVFVNDGLNCVLSVKMKSLLVGVMLSSVVAGGFLSGYPDTLVYHLPLPLHRHVSHTVDELYDTYFSQIADNRDHRRDNEVGVVSEYEQIYLNKLNERNRNAQQPKHINSENYKGPQKVERTAYLLVKTMRQRDKRYISSYLTLCHFKICNMGRKRTARYFHMIRTTDDNEVAVKHRSIMN